MGHRAQTTVDRRGSAALLEQRDVQELLSRVGVQPNLFRTFVLRTLVKMRPELAAKLTAASKRSGPQPFPY
jgi:hypothetical protein